MVLTWAFVGGAGDGNRTRTVSLGICTARRRTRSDLRRGGSVIDRETPFVTGVNGTLMARRSCARPALTPPRLAPPVPSIACHPSDRGRRVKAREATAQRLGFDSADAAEAIVQRGSERTPQLLWY